MTSSPAHRIGVDLGGTKIEAVVVTLVSETTGPERNADAAPAVLARARVPTNRTLGYDHVLEQTRALIFDVARQADVDPRATPIGVGMPGAVTMVRPDGRHGDEPLIKNSNTTCLNGRPFHRDLARAVGAPIAFANDANCFALAEAMWGAARGARVAFGVILGTGVGGGVVIANEAGLPRAWEGAQGIAGEWGHLVLDPTNGPACYCGRRGCVETYLSGPAIEAEYERRAGAPRTLAEIAQRASATATKDPSGATARGDAVAHSLLEERLDIFGRALASVINVLDPDVVVLGGGVSNLEALLDRGRDAVARWVFNDRLATRIAKHALGDSAGVLGAALLP